MESSSSTDLVRVGVVGKPHGVAGFVVVHDETDNPDRFVAGETVRTGSGARLVVDEVKPTGSPALVLVRFRGVDGREAAEALRGETLWVDSGRRRRLGPDEFWPDMLEGLEVRSPRGEVLGRVRSVVEGAAQERLEVETASGDRVEVPFVGELVPEVHPEAGYVVVVPVPGLFPA